MEGQRRLFLESKQIRQIKFRPQEYSGKFKLRLARNSKYVGQLNWHESKFCGPYGINKIHQHIHYLACHAPKNVRKRWLYAWIRSIKHYKTL